jgi:hypothetical protein
MITWTHSSPTWEFRRRVIFSALVLIVHGLHRTYCIFISSVFVFYCIIIGAHA